MSSFARRTLRTTAAAAGVAALGAGLAGPAFATTDVTAPPVHARPSDDGTPLTSRPAGPDRVADVPALAAHLSCASARLAASVHPAEVLADDQHSESRSTIAVRAAQLDEGRSP